MLTTKYGKEVLLFVVGFIVVVFVTARVVAGAETVIDGQIFRPADTEPTEADVENVVETETEAEAPQERYPTFESKVARLVEFEYDVRDRMDRIVASIPVREFDLEWTAIILDTYRKVVEEEWQYAYNDLAGLDLSTPAPSMNEIPIDIADVIIERTNKVKEFENRPYPGTEIVHMYVEDPLNVF